MMLWRVMYSITGNGSLSTSDIRTVDAGVKVGVMSHFESFVKPIGTIA